MNEYVPSTENVRNVYAYIGQGFAPSERKSKEQAEAEFDRWLAARDEAAKAEIAEAEKRGFEKGVNSAVKAMNSIRRPLLKPWTRSGEGGCE